MGVWVLIFGEGIHYSTTNQPIFCQSGFNKPLINLDLLKIKHKKDTICSERKVPIC